MNDINVVQQFTYSFRRPDDWTDEQWAAFCAPPAAPPWTLLDDLASVLETSYELADDALRTIRDAGYVLARPDQLKDGEVPYRWDGEVSK